MVEQYSIDEAFVDMTGTCHLFGTAKETEEQIRERICREGSAQQSLDAIDYMICKIKEQQ